MTEPGIVSDSSVHKPGVGDVSGSFWRIESCYDNIDFVRQFLNEVIFWNSPIRLNDK